MYAGVETEKFEGKEKKEEKEPVILEMEGIGSKSMSSGEKAKEIKEEDDTKTQEENNRFCGITIDSINRKNAIDLGGIASSAVANAITSAESLVASVLVTASSLIFSYASEARDTGKRHEEIEQCKAILSNLEFDFEEKEIDIYFEKNQFDLFQKMLYGSLVFLAFYIMVSVISPDNTTAATLLAVISTLLLPVVNKILSGEQAKHSKKLNSLSCKELAKEIRKINEKMGIEDKRMSNLIEYYSNNNNRIGLTGVLESKICDFKYYLDKKNCLSETLYKIENISNFLRNEKEIIENNKINVADFVMCYEKVQKIFGELENTKVEPVNSIEKRYEKVLTLEELISKIHNKILLEISEQQENTTNNINF